MARYIDAEKIPSRLLSVAITDDLYGRGIKTGIDTALRIIKEQTTADVEEVKNGEWKEETKFLITDNPDDDGYWASVYICSNCGREEPCKEPYCHCGAKMDGEKKQKNDFKE